MPKFFLILFCFYLIKIDDFYKKRGVGGSLFDDDYQIQYNIEEILRKGKLI